MPTLSPQPSLLDDSSSNKSVQRTIHYLGSKLRVLNQIRRAVSSLAPRGQPVCDLFAGSGVVSLALASDWDVTSVDIQEYSRVLCNGLYHLPSNATVTAADLCDQAQTGTLRKRLRAALRDLLAHEKQCLANCSDVGIEDLCDLLEHGSLLPHNCQTDIPPALRNHVTTALSRLQELGLSTGPETVVTRHFGGRYFSWQQAIDFDALLAEVHLIDKPFQDFFLATVLVAASDVVNTVGKHFAQPIKLRNANGVPKTHLVRQTIRDRSLNVFHCYRASCESLIALGRSPGHHRVVRSDYRDFLKNDPTEFSVFYADPPYTRDHYSRYYHVLETMALRDDPEVSTTKIRSNGMPRLSRGVYRSQRHQSPFCIPSKAAGAFSSLFTSVAKRATPLVLSYSPYQVTAGNRPRLLTIDQLLEIARQHFNEVEILPVDGISHNKLNLTERNVTVQCPAEVLITCRPY